MPKHFINEQHDVEDAGASRTFVRGERREDYADPWQATGNVILLGLPGSGRAELARLLSERTGQPVIAPADAQTAVEALQGQGAIIVLADDLVDCDEVRPLIHGAGKVFYLMADTRLLSERVAERDSVADRDSVWRALSARLAEVEPTFYSVLHFILQSAQPPAELVDDALEKIGY